MQYKTHLFFLVTAAATALGGTFERGLVSPNFTTRVFHVPFGNYYAVFQFPVGELPTKENARLFWGEAGELHESQITYLSQLFSDEFTVRSDRFPGIGIVPPNRSISRSTLLGTRIELDELPASSETLERLLTPSHANRVDYRSFRIRSAYRGPGFDWISFAMPRGSAYYRNHNFMLDVSRRRLYQQAEARFSCSGPKCKQEFFAPSRNDKERKFTVLTDRNSDWAQIVGDGFVAKLERLSPDKMRTLEREIQAGEFRLATLPPARKIGRAFRMTREPYDLVVLDEPAYPRDFYFPDMRVYTGQPGQMEYRPVELTEQGKLNDWFVRFTGGFVRFSIPESVRRPVIEQTIVSDTGRRIRQVKALLPIPSVSPQSIGIGGKRFAMPLRHTPCKFYIIEKR